MFRLNLSRFNKDQQRALATTAKNHFIIVRKSKSERYPDPSRKIKYRTMSTITEIVKSTLFCVLKDRVAPTLNSTIQQQISSNREIKM